MKIYLYWLTKNETPYYVGVTRNKRNRYSGEKKNDMVFIEEFDNRIEAMNAETYWINQLKAWGFQLINKEEKPAKISFKKKNMQERRVRLNNEQWSDLDKIELLYGIEPSDIIGKCVDKLFISLGGCNKINIE